MHCYSSIFEDSEIFYFVRRLYFWFIYLKGEVWCFLVARWKWHSVLLAFNLIFVVLCTAIPKCLAWFLLLPCGYGTTWHNWSRYPQSTYCFYCAKLRWVQEAREKAFLSSSISPTISLLRLLQTTGRARMTISFSTAASNAWLLTVNSSLVRNVWVMLCLMI